LSTFSLSPARISPWRRPDSGRRTMSFEGKVSGSWTVL